MQLGRLVLGVADGERRLGEELQELAVRHAEEADIHHMGRTLAGGCTWPHSSPPRRGTARWQPIRRRA
jgi:hypothetical protein